MSLQLEDMPEGGGLARAVIALMSACGLVEGNIISLVLSELILGNTIGGAIRHRSQGNVIKKTRKTNHGFARMPRIRLRIWVRSNSWRVETVLKTSSWVCSGRLGIVRFEIDGLVVIR